MIWKLWISNDMQEIFYFISLISSTGLLLLNLGIKCNTRTHFKFRIACLQQHGYNTPIRKEENICFLHRSRKFIQEDFLVIIKNHALQAFNLTVTSKENPTIKQNFQYFCRQKGIDTPFHQTSSSIMMLQVFTGLLTQDLFSSKNRNHTPDNINPCLPWTWGKGDLRKYHP